MVTYGSDVVPWVELSWYTEKREVTHIYIRSKEFTNKTVTLKCTSLIANSVGGPISLYFITAY